MAVRAVALIATLAVALAACSRNPVTGELDLAPTMTVEQEKQVGAQEHPKIIKAFGGVYEDEAINAYVNGIGEKLAANSEYAGQQFTFTVLDSPVVNAFALPGGYVYVTRGLMTLASSEAELAGVIGHEIGHVTARHPARRQTGSLLGGLAGIGVAIATGSAEAARTAQSLAAGTVAGYSRKQELESDMLGVRYISRAGYDPYAQADFLGKLGASAGLSAKLAGRDDYDPNRIDFLSTHPATPQRVAQAIESAKLSGIQVDDLPRYPDRYLERIRGMVYGDDAKQGFVRGRRFVHPELLFAFEVPQGFRLINSPSAVVGVGPEKQQAQLRSAKVEPNKSTLSFIANDLAEQLKLPSRLRDAETFRVNGLDAATGWTYARTNAGDAYVRVVGIRHSQDRVYYFVMLGPRAAADVLDRDFRQIAESFEKISERKARGFKPYRIEPITVRRGQTVASLARGLPFNDFKEERLRVLNGLRPDEEVRPGQRLKLIVE